MKLSRLSISALVLAAGLALTACSDDAKPTTTDASAVAGAGSDSLNGGAGAGSASVRPGSLEDFRQNVGDRVFFALDQYTLSPEAREVLTKQIAFIKQYADKAPITVEGHCDERGTREYNLALGARRANAVKHFLLANGVNAKQIKTVSYGKERPEVQGSDETSWEKNRRAVTVLVGFGS